MKNIVTKCLVMGALAIGITSNAMAAEEAVKSSHAHKLIPIAFEVNEGENKATALLLLGKKGDVNGLICYTSTQTNLGDNCSRVTGKISQYEGYNHIELQGIEIKQSKINKTTALINIPVVTTTTGAPMMYTNNLMAAPVEFGGPATSIIAQYKQGKFITAAGEATYGMSNTYPKCINSTGLPVPCL